MSCAILFKLYSIWFFRFISFFWFLTLNNFSIVVNANYLATKKKEIYFCRFCKVVCHTFDSSIDNITVYELLAHECTMTNKKRKMIRKTKIKEKIAARLQSISNVLDVFFFVWSQNDHWKFWNLNHFYGTITLGLG